MGNLIFILNIQVPHGTPFLRKKVYNEDLFTSLQQRYEDELSMEWVGMYGFNNTYGIGCS